MGTGDLKVDLINGAFSHMRISGITRQAGKEDNAIGLVIAEELAAHLTGLNVCLNYNFEDEPDLNSVSGVDKKLRASFKWVLAEHLLSEFGKGAQDKIDPNLYRKSAAGLSFLHASTANPQQTQYPSRQSIGNGNTLRWGRYRRFYNPVIEAPNTCETNRMVVGNVDDFVEHFDSWLRDGEDVASFTISANTGLTIVSSSLSTPDVSYQINAVGPGTFLQVKIIATSSDGRITTRLINFELTTLRDLI